MVGYIVFVSTQKGSAVTDSSPHTVLEGIPGALTCGTCHQVTAAGARTRYWQYGAGMNTGVFPSEVPNAGHILLVHGFRGDHHGLEIIANRLLSMMPGVSIISPDLPGFGRSDTLPAVADIVGYVGWLRELVRHVDTKGRIHLVGHSFGSIVAAAYAAEHPDTVDRVSLINPISEPALKGAQRVASRAASLYYRAGAALPERAGFALLRSQLVTRITSEMMMRTKDPEMSRFINGQHAAYFGSFCSRRAVLEAYNASISYTAAQFTPKITVPVQMIVAECDDLGTLGTARSMFSALESRSPATGQRFDVVPQVGHLIHYETPTVAARLITEFAHQNFLV